MSSIINRIKVIIKVKLWSRAKRKEQNKLIEKKRVTYSNGYDGSVDYSGIIGVVVGLIFVGFIGIIIFNLISLMDVAIQSMLEANVASSNTNITMGNSNAITNDISILFQLLPILLILLFPIIFIKFMMFND